LTKRKIFGCSFPILIIVAVVFLALTIFGLLIGPIGTKLLGQEIGPSWLRVESPEPTLSPGVITHIGNFPITNTMITAWITIIILVMASYIAFRKPKLVPTGIQKVMEFIYTALLDFCISVAGEKNGRRFFPFVATIFMFVITNAWLGLLPFYGDALYIVGEGGHHIPLLRAANTDINIPLGLALFSWISIETFGLKANGFVPYLKRFVNLHRIGAGFNDLLHGKIKSAVGNFIFGIIDVFVGFLEGVSEFIRIVSFTFRLFGNMTAGEVLILVAAFLAPLVVGSIVYGMEMFFGFLQALIFGGLTLVWMNMAVEKHGEEEHT
jgi:F-type H+-transporting ATPase subunit a